MGSPLIVSNQAVSVLGTVFGLKMACVSSFTNAVQCLERPRVLKAIKNAPLLPLFAIACHALAFWTSSCQVTSLVNSPKRLTTTGKLESCAISLKLASNEQVWRPPSGFQRIANWNLLIACEKFQNRLPKSRLGVSGFRD